MDGRPNSDEILDLIFSSVASVLPGRDRLLTPGTRLLGSGAVLDSMGLVNVIVEVEQSLSEQFGVSCILADERAMSRERSPFRDIGSLAEYVMELVHGPSESTAE
jgi:acyl carrier protein